MEFWLQDWKVGGFQEYTVRGYGTPPSPPRDGIQFNEPIYPNKLACIYIYVYTKIYIYNMCNPYIHTYIHTHNNNNTGLDLCDPECNVLRGFGLLGDQG